MQVRKYSDREAPDCPLASMEVWVIGDGECFPDRVCDTEVEMCVTARLW